MEHSDGMVGRNSKMKRKGRTVLWNSRMEKMCGPLGWKKKDETVG